MDFAAIDFETANSRRDSACAIGIAIVEGGRLTAVERYLIRPPTREFRFTCIHSLTWESVRRAPAFPEVWQTVAPRLASMEFLAAHNASFDRGVLDACCRRHRLQPSPSRFVCTVKLARAVWRIHPTKLPDVCDRLGIALQHHDPGSDAEACARIVLAATAQGWRP